ncbi:MAG: hypothetical protein M0R80_03115 [Proteobacteria bacterium]|jgi:uncharacterized protein YegL|nr:hypothetical protein [Pseudomonadota bacterium]
MGESKQLVPVSHKAGHFGFSAVGLNDLGASEYTLVTVVADRSGSTADFQVAMEQVLKEVFKGCHKSDRCDNLMIRLVAFEDFAEEVHGFKMLSQINEGDYDGVLHPGGMTALYDAVVDAIEATTNYAQYLGEQDYNTNAFVVVVTDGMDNRSKTTPLSCKTAFGNAVKSEYLESMMSALVAVNVADPTALKMLQEFHKEAGFSEEMKEMKDFNEKTFAKLANWISKSVSSTSQALGTGGPSQSVAF